ncbi:hypothetical protein VPNG_09037 [Cytospora leucostoma]|uniref:Uncharacterized protein n=1 Tax=Cytospora leucostoma TaxID=1230097 RepID=A0A423VZ18_9PEZI|nr:hypothetical protein VPNG_09037 [Cytospora leucostoma]
MPHSCVITSHPVISGRLLKEAIPSAVRQCEKTFKFTLETPNSTSSSRLTSDSQMVEQWSPLTTWYAERLRIVEDNKILLSGANGNEDNYNSS